MKILIVDDVESIRKLLLHILKEEGYKRLFSAQSAEEAFEILKAEEIDLILMDIMMPDLNGIEVCRIIKNDLGLTDIKVIMVTGKTDTDYLKEAFEAGAMDYIEKPINKVELLARVNSVVELIKKEQELQQTVELLEEANKELERMVSIDGLTQIANRKFFDNTLKKEWGQARRRKSKLALLMLDIDNFKDYNDTYGHQGGDECLKELAKLFERLLFRSGDLVARYGGEEFAIILPETDLKGAKEVANRVREGVEGLQLEHKASKVSDYVTVSVGVAVAEPKSKDGEKDLIEAADRALYKAKDAGRNKVKVASEIIS
ncbi:diguanylate cyclase [Natroniella sulfidigena]|uniref:diguanylate cyclase domain-containing protein n=1 Tax=Natroniella sulfidigena TaxID=723921 RepID=UPI00200A41B0|nr:diguanylate cyclase [Natroniella sulfidigena]MCK8818028.1 diguanylate cyclase [Natroniella sulfidigena]